MYLSLLVIFVCPAVVPLTGTQSTHTVKPGSKFSTSHSRKADCLSLSSILVVKFLTVLMHGGSVNQQKKETSITNERSIKKMLSHHKRQ